MVGRTQGAVRRKREPEHERGGVSDFEKKIMGAALHPEVRAALEARLRAPTTNRHQASRARIVLLAAEGRSTRSIAREIGAMPNTVRGWRTRFAREGLAGLEDKLRPTSKYGAATDWRILALLDQPPPKGYARWTGPLLADALGDVHEQQVWRILRARKIDLAGRRSWCKSNDPEFFAKVADAGEKAIEAWREWLAIERRSSPHTVAAYCIDLAQFLDFIAERLGRKPQLPDLAALKAGDFRSYLVRRMEEGAARSSIARAMAVVRNFFKFLARHDLASNPYIAAMRWPKVPSRLPRALSADDACGSLDGIAELAVKPWAGSQTRRSSHCFTAVACAWARRWGSRGETRRSGPA
jgi:transposase